jgi:FtsZ-binding cell division protein ZapB
MSFLHSKTVQDELDTIEELQMNIEILSEIVDSGSASEETYKSYFNCMSECLEKQRILWTRLQYEDDPDVMVLRESIEQLTSKLGRDTNTESVSHFLSRLQLELNTNITDARAYLGWDF